MPPMRQTQQWVDRFGSTHQELSPNVPDMDSQPSYRVISALETDWAHAVHEGGEHSARRCGDMAVKALVAPNPIISDDPDGNPDLRLYTWVVESPAAKAVLIWVNGLFDHKKVADSELHRLTGSDLWTLSLRMPADWRASYTITTWEGDGEPPWRVDADRMTIRKAALSNGVLDERNQSSIMNSSLVEGPSAREDRWKQTSKSVSVVEETVAGTHFWVYSPSVSEQTPLLVLFDGQHWMNNLELPQQIDAAIAAGRIPPVHLLMIDSVDVDYRWDNVGVPGGQIDSLIDDILPHVRATHQVSPRGEDTIISGASFGGLASLWALALSEGEIGHAIAQSPSLWRFDIADALSAAENWVSIQLQAGRYEGEMLQLAEQLAEDLSGDIREVRVQGTNGGHDWAWWRVHLLHELTRLLEKINQNRN